VKPTTAELAAAQDIARRTANRRLSGRDWEGVGAEDVVQDVLLRFAELDLDVIENWDAWVVTATRNRCADVMAAELRHGNKAIDPTPGASGAGLDPSAQLSTWVLGPSAAGMRPQLIAHILEVLSDQERAVVTRHLDGWSNAEIAEEFGYASARSVAVTISRARAKVRQRFDSRRERDELLGPQRPY
jgi:RNA polymerase sigma factor (sigma-70 family)